MADIMRPVPFSELLSRIAGELRNHGSIFGIDSSLFYHDKGKKAIRVFSEEASTPVGPAAGPHTQLAQNIITAYLEGARFIELKTVQIMDHLEIAKPCIDARDECYNVEWSTEFTVEKAYDEYLKAWIILHILECLEKGNLDKPSFIFNMSVGYDLKGIKEKKMQSYIDSMMDASGDKFDDYIAEASSLLGESLFEGTVWEGREKKAIKELGKISRNISPSVTISTMHGCPPDEIEAICSYMIEEKHLDTFVKLNPTLLGYEEAREVLDSHGFQRVVLRRESFEHDLQYSDAVPMLERLVALAEKEGRGFGVKLTNTLGSVNDGSVLPGDEMYMSGRALLPLSMRVALRLSEHFAGKLPVSYSGGVSVQNASLIFSSGIHPITLATDMLKPGGYARMAQIASLLEESDGWNKTEVSSEAIKKIIDSSDANAERDDWKGGRRAKLDSPLPLTDCFVAPCVESCPIHQDIPDYIALAGEGRWAEAIGLIYLKNALPNITGWICDHECQNHCTRLDYEGPVEIREIKRQAAEKGFKEFHDEIWEKPDESADVKAAVIGAGPAGLSAAFFLARAGFRVTVFEREKNAGGVVRNVIPDFRIPDEAIEKDVSFIEEHGVEFRFSSETDTLSLRKEGYDYIFISVGAEKPNDPGITGNGKIISAVSFLLSLKRGDEIDAGKHVAIIGGGNTAMDAARAAKRMKGVESVTVIYRRTAQEMPADREEYKEALSEGIVFRFLSSPADFTDGRLRVSIMELGEKDSSGRRRPVATGKYEELAIDTVISAIGEKADPELLRKLASDEGEDDGVFIIGDAATGPSTVVRCMASARSAVDKAIDMVYEDILEEDEDEDECSCGHHHEDGEECTCGHHHDEDDEDEISEEEEIKLREAEDEFFRNITEKKSRIRKSVSKDDDFFAHTEAKRCTECSYLCLKCVDVCPNRANVALDMRSTGLFDDPFQILHLDAYCNECGNCATFCPHNGKPYKDKFTLFSLREDFENSTNSGFYYENDELYVRLDGKVTECTLTRDGEIDGDIPEEIKAMIEEVFLSYPYLLGAVEE